jgi:ZIP family zinc transporter
MTEVLLTALGVGGATVLGAAIGFIFKGASHKFSDIVLSFAAGVMLAAAVLGLIVPSLEYGGKWKLLITVIGIFTGGFTAAAAGICAAVFFGYVMAMIFKAREKR